MKRYQKWVCIMIGFHRGTALMLTSFLYPKETISCVGDPCLSISLRCARVVPDTRSTRDKQLKFPNDKEDMEQRVLVA